MSSTFMFLDPGCQEIAKWKRVKNKAHKDWDKTIGQADMTWTEESEKAGVDGWGGGEHT